MMFCVVGDVSPRHAGGAVTHHVAENGLVYIGFSLKAAERMTHGVRWAGLDVGALAPTIESVAKGALFVGLAVIVEEYVLRF